MQKYDAALWSSPCVYKPVQWLGHDIAVSDGVFKVAQKAGRQGVLEAWTAFLFLCRVSWFLLVPLFLSVLLSNLLGLHLRWCAVVTQSFRRTSSSARTEGIMTIIHNFLHWMILNTFDAYSVEL